MTTLLAVDDSVTMRKVLEITFASEEYRFVSAANGEAGLAAAQREKPDIVLVDVTLPDKDGYSVCSAIKSELPNALVVILSSKQGPYDAAKGTAAGADEFLEKPFDTQQAIEKLRKVAQMKPAAPTGKPAAATAAPAAAPPAAAKPAAPPPLAPVAAVRPAAPPPVPQRQAPMLSPTTPSMDSVVRPQPAPARVEAPLPVVTPAAAPPPAAPAPAAAPPAAAHPVAAAATASMGPALTGLGLTQAQVDAVLALSREIVERVVWEVVPQLAETLIKEEIKRLTAEG